MARNPGLAELRVRKVRGVDGEFVRWLGSEANPGRARLAVLGIEECAGLQMGRVEDYDWLGGLEGLTHLRISGCRLVDEKVLRGVSENYKNGGYWDELDADDKIACEGVMEVDEACR